ncbi:MAG: hypothetical protein GY699_24905 [Desulfobacteraceae bacterium]|nr:hypothetical protein [Desulfobacteraceae bacterium]
MKISNFKIVKENDYIKAVALVQFEDCKRPDSQVYIQTLKQYETGFKANPDAFLVGCLLPAIHLGEKRIHIEDEICPFLKEGLDVAMNILKDWTKGKYKPLTIEAKTRSQIKRVDPSRAGMVMSGGMDSLAALRLNRMHYPKIHPGYVKDCFFLHGFDIGGVVERGMKYPVFERAKEAIVKITDDAGAKLIPVYTNIRHLCDERVLWLNSFFGAVLASMAHSFSNRIDMMFIGSSYDIPNLHPCGSHPLLDPEYSSYNMRIRHRDYELSRLEKIKIVSKWDVAFNNFRVCLANVPDRLNCGKCEKCVRTMTELTALDLLHKTHAFVEDEIMSEDIEQFDITIRVRPPFYWPMIPLLRKQGRDDLANTIEKKLEETDE